MNTKNAKTLGWIVVAAVLLGGLLIWVSKDKEVTPEPVATPVEKMDVAPEAPPKDWPCKKGQKCLY